jgi:hypothetical protein
MLSFGVVPGHDPSGDLLDTAALAEALGFDPADARTGSVDRDSSFNRCE